MSIFPPTDTFMSILWPASLLWPHPQVISTQTHHDRGHIQAYPMATSTHGHTPSPCPPDDGDHPNLPIAMAISTPSLWPYPPMDGHIPYSLSLCPPKSCPSTVMPTPDYAHPQSYPNHAHRPLGMSLHVARAACSHGTPAPSQGA